MPTSRKLIVGATVIASMISFSVPSQAQVTSLMGSSTLGVFLDNKINHVGGLINSAADAGNTVLAGAGGQVLQALLSTKSSYADSLDKTANELKTAQVSVLNDVVSKVQVLENGTFDQLRDIAAQGALIANELPLSNRFPQVMSYSPYYVVAVGEGKDTVKVYGNFFDAARQGYDPSLAVGKLTVKPALKSTRELDFQVPVKAFLQSNGALQFNEAVLTVPYRESCFLVGKCAHRAMFDLMIVSLPKSAGKIRFFTQTPVSQAVPAQRVGPTHSQESSDDDIPDPISNGKQWCEGVTPGGWQVDTRSVKLNVEWQEGDWGERGNTSNIANACWNIWTKHHGGSWLHGPDSGKVRFHLSWTEVRSDEKILPAEQDEELKWGTSTTFTIPSKGHWDKAEYIQFDNIVQKFNDVTFKSPYIQVTSSGNVVTVRTIP